MDKFNKTLNQLKDSSGEMRPNLHVLNEIVPIETQVKYFRYSQYIKSQKTNLDKDFLITKLFSPDIKIEDRRYYLSSLAGIPDVSAYRAIETYHSSPLEPELASWAAMALVESRILLDADLSGEQQFFVSTGLGGRDNLLRFFGVITTSTRDDFTDLQRQILLRELQFSFDRHKIEVEDISIKNNYITFTILCGLDNDARIIIENAISESNELGKFVDPRFILTNIRKIDDSDISRMLSKDSSLDKD